MKNEEMKAPITFGSVCSGIEAASVAWQPLGWRAAWLAEIEPFPCAVLAHHYPDVPNLGDMTKIAPLVRDGFVPAPDVFCGGTPCQAFSIAGLRQSLDDERGNLSLIFCEIANEIDARRATAGLLPTIVFWENVLGVLSTKDNAFGCFLAGLAGEDDPIEPPGGKWAHAGCVYGPKRTVAWRVLDAQYFGVAQRRRRVFVVASAREGFDPAQVLFEFDGVRRDSPPSRQARENTAGVTAVCAGSGGGQNAGNGLLTAHDATALGQGFNDDLLEGRQVICMAHGQGGAEISSERSPTLTCNHEAPIAAYSVAIRGRQAGATAELGDNLAGTLRASQGGGDKPYVLIQQSQERLGPGNSRLGAAAEQMIRHQHALLMPELAAPAQRSLEGPRGSALDTLIAFSGNDYGADAQYDLSPTLRAGNHKSSHANGGQPPAIAIQGLQRIDGCSASINLGSSIAYSIQAGALRLNPASGPDGVGVQEGIAYTIEARSEVQAVAFAENSRGEITLEGGDGQRTGTLSTGGGKPGQGLPMVCLSGAAAYLGGDGDGRANSDISNASAAREVAGCITSNYGKQLDNSDTALGPNVAIHGMAVRRLTPRECERLQGFPDDYTLIKFGRTIKLEKLESDWIKYLLRGGVMTLAQVCQAAADGPRYKALGNSWAVPNAAWIGRRIDAAMRADYSPGIQDTPLVVPGHNKGRFVSGSSRSGRQKNDV